MTWNIFKIVRSLIGKCVRSRRTTIRRKQPCSFRPELRLLEDRITPSGASQLVTTPYEILTDNRHDGSKWLDSTALAASVRETPKGLEISADSGTQDGNLATTGTRAEINTGVSFKLFVRLPRDRYVVVWVEVRSSASPIIGTDPFIRLEFTRPNENGPVTLAIKGRNGYQQLMNVGLREIRDDGPSTWSIRETADESAVEVILNNEVLARFQGGLKANTHFWATAKSPYGTGRFARVTLESLDLVSWVQPPPPAPAPIPTSLIPPAAPSNPPAPTQGPSPQGALSPATQSLLFSERPVYEAGNRQQAVAEAANILRQQGKQNATEQEITDFFKLGGRYWVARDIASALVVPAPTTQAMQASTVPTSLPKTPQEIVAQRIAETKDEVERKQLLSDVPGAQPSYSYLKLFESLGVPAPLVNGRVPGTTPAPAASTTPAASSSQLAAAPSPFNIQDAIAKTLAVTTDPATKQQLLASTPGAMPTYAFRQLFIDAGYEPQLVGGRIPVTTYGKSVLSDANKSGDLETQSFAERSALPATGTPNHAYSYADNARGVTVHASPGSHFALFPGGGVRLVDGFLKSGTTALQAAQPTRSSLFDQEAKYQAPGTYDGKTYVHEQLAYQPIAGKTIRSVGGSVFNPTTGVNEKAGANEVFITYTDGTVERRKFGGQPGTATPIGQFGRTAADLGITDQTEIKAADGSVARAPIPSTAKPSEELFYVGPQYTAEDGTVRTAGPGHVFLQDPETGRMLERSTAEGAKAIRQMVSRPVALTITGQSTLAPPLADLATAVRDTLDLVRKTFGPEEAASLKQAFAEGAFPSVSSIADMLKEVTRWLAEATRQKFDKEWSAFRTLVPAGEEWKIPFVFGNWGGAYRAPANRGLDPAPIDSVDAAFRWHDKALIAADVSWYEPDATLMNLELAGRLVLAMAHPDTTRAGVLFGTAAGAALAAVGTSELLAVANQSLVDATLKAGDLLTEANRWLVTTTSDALNAAHTAYWTGFNAWVDYWGDLGERWAS